MTPASKTLVVARKTLRDFSGPKLLLAFFLPYGALTYLFATGMTSNAPEALATRPLGAQEQLLSEAFSELAVPWAAGLPAMALVAVLAANGVAKAEQEGTLRILLSKPVSRRQVLLGKVLAVATFGYIATVATVLLWASALFAASGASPAALGGSLGRLLPGTLVYALFVVAFVTAVGTAFAVTTASRLKTALGTLTIPALFFGFMFGRTLTGGGGTYVNFRLYYLDLSYHFGNVFVALQDALGGGFSPLTQAALGLVTGVFDSSGWGLDPLVGGFSGSVPVTGHVPAVASIALIAVLSAVLLAAAVRRFDAKDVS